MAQKWFKYLFGESGDKTAVPDVTDPSGYVSYQSGYPVDYERVLGTDPLAKAIERQKLNQVLYDVTSGIQHLQKFGFPDYIDATANGGTAYAYDIGAIVRFTDKLNYRNTVLNNTNAPNVSGWVLYNNDADAIVASTAKTTPVDADLFGLVDSAASNVLKKITWGNIKTALTSLFAPLASPAFTDTPTAPTAIAGTNTTQLATTAFVKAKSELDSIGVGQTWQPVTRTSDVQYTNSTGKPIALRVENTSPVNVGSYTTIAIDGVSMLLGAVNNSSTAAGSTSDMIIIGVGKTYTLTDTNVSTRTTYELR